MIAACEEGRCGHGLPGVQAADREMPSWVSTRGDEADLVLERDDGQVTAFEIKAGTRVGGEDLHGLRLLKERLGPRLQEAEGWGAGSRPGSFQQRA
jgi:hypothetical protein